MRRIAIVDPSALLVLANSGQRLGETVSRAKDTQTVLVFLDQSRANSDLEGNFFARLSSQARIWLLWNRLNKSRDEWPITICKSLDLRKASSAVPVVGVARAVLGDCGEVGAIYLALTMQLPNCSTVILTDTPRKYDGIDGFDKTNLASIQRWV